MIPERAGCGRAARPVRRAATGNGAMAWTEAPAYGRKPPATATLHRPTATAPVVDSTPLEHLWAFGPLRAGRPRSQERRARSWGPSGAGVGRAGRVASGETMRQAVPFLGSRASCPLEHRWAFGPLRAGRPRSQERRPRSRGPSGAGVGRAGRVASGDSMRQAVLFLGARASWCAVQRHTLSAGVIPARQVSFQPVALGTVVEATKQLKHSEKRVRRDSASMQAVTRSERRAGPENSECGSRFRQDREKAAATRGSERHEHPRGSAGVVATACMYKGGCATREAPVGGRKRYGPTAAS